tara:strand:- start:2430 stop:2747 length:318 start_codon:yes stop_codon:yes gene_type:complete
MSMDKMALLEEASDFDLIPRYGHVYPFMRCLTGIADAGKHVRDWVGHHLLTIPLPTRLTDAWDLPTKGHLTEADSAYAELAQVTTRPATTLAPVPNPHAILGWTL